MSSALATMALGTGVAYAGIKTAESQLAKTLSSSLSQYLDVEPADIESQLLAYGKIELTGVKVKPQFVPIAGSGAMLDGEIESILFSWTWGTSILNNSTLTVSGARLRLVIDPDAEVPTEATEITAENTSSGEAPTESESDSDSNSNDSGPNDTVQNVLDQLSVSIADIKLGIQIKNSDTDSVVVEAESMGLLACGRDGTETAGSEGDNEDEQQAPLLQQVVMKMLRVYVSHNNEDVPVLEPLDYMANVIRNRGKRFGDASGLEIAGKLPEEERGVVVHLGKIQLQALLAIQKELESKNAPADDSTKEASTTEATEDPADLSVVLPIPSIKLVLPNDASIATRLWRFVYFPEESVCQMEGKGTSIVVGKDDFKLLQLDAASTFLVNLTGKMVALGHTESSDSMPKLAQIDWKEKQTKPVLEGFAQLSELLNPIGTEQKKAELQQQSPTDSILHPVGTKVADGAKELRPAKPWSLNVDGMISARFEGTKDGEQEWLEASITSPYFEMATRSDELIHKVGLQRARIGPTSFGDMMIDMGPTSVEANAVKKSATATISEFMQRIFGMHH